MIGTYRVQLHQGFDFDDVIGILDLVQALGVDTLYTSPTLQAVPGSTHGYDVVDHGRINPELGGEAGHGRLSEALAARGMKRIVDLVPNHMAIGPWNRWWWDVLENGRSSRYAHWFDVDWAHAAVDRILLPVLGKSYGRALEDGELSLRRDGGSLVVCYYEHEAPIDPGSLGALLDRAAREAGHDGLAFLADAFASLPPPEEARRRHRNKEVLRGLLARLLAEEPEVARAVDAVIAEVSADPDALHALLELQNHRFAYWRTGRQELDYRRFFDIDTLVGLRVEDAEVFDATHALVLEHLRRGEVQGLRIDHIDGLRDPEAYLRRLRAAAPEALLVVEKILEVGEPLRASWPVDGTTGYDFLNLVQGLFVDPAAEQALTDLYVAFTGESGDWDAVVRDCKRLVMREGLGSDLNRLVELFVRVCSRHRRQRDHTQRDIVRALRAVLAHLPVYRTYVAPGRVEELDRELVRGAIEGARAEEPELEPDLFDFLQQVLLLEIDGPEEQSFAFSFQQVSGPVMAKGAEDTAFYVYNRFVALNEVGGNPGRFGVSVDEWHAAMMACTHPRTLRTLSTHDTKRSEDVRARLLLLSELPQAWRNAVLRWCMHNERHKQGGMPDRNTEYLLYQTLVGAWPLEVDRAVAYMEKATREAKRFTSWARPNPAWEAALKGFISGILGDADFIAQVEAFVEPLVEPGRRNSLAQLLLQLTVPGIPDRYQGAELWELSLVDPDNRRPVDWELRRRLLSELDGLTVEQIAARSDEGLPKLYVLREGMRCRREREEAFAGDYRPLIVEGTDRAVAFCRGGDVVTVVPRLSLDLEWGDAAVLLPPGLWRERLADRTFQGTAPLGTLYGSLPVALLERMR